MPKKVGTIYNYSGIPKNKISGPLYRLLFNRYPAKTFLKHLIPENARNEIKRWLGSRLSKKEDMPSEIREYLVGNFKEDLLELVNLFEDKQQKDIIKAWITYEYSN